MDSFLRKTASMSLILTGLFALSLKSTMNRSPSSVGQDYELHLQSLGLSSASELHSLDKVFIRATFDGSEVYDFGRNETLNLNLGENRRLDLRVDLKPTWVHNDQLDFKLEIVQNGLVPTVLFRCATVVKGLSVYNRSYTCSVPGEVSPVFSYRVAKKGSVDLNSALASAHSQINDSSQP